MASVKHARGNEYISSCLHVKEVEYQQWVTKEKWFGDGKSTNVTERDLNFLSPVLTVGNMKLS